MFFFKNLLSILLAVLTLISSGAFGDPQGEDPLEPVGGWTEYAVGRIPSVTEKTAFENAVKDTDYADYTLISTLGTQVVAGTNYKFLCKAPDGTKVVMVVYLDLQNNSSVTSVSNYK